ncbi:MAG: cupredoxin family protein [Proteobacteria bacterium]|nr:cupredoxin family protein [Pseudomonadota bacterium]
MKTRTRQLALAAALAAPLMAWAAPGHEGHGGGHGDSHASAAGQPGDPAKVSRTVDVQMDDSMRFTPAQVQVKAGETIRFLVVNKGKLPHEMVLGTVQELDAHAEMMRKMPDMKHAEPNQVSLGAGQRGGIVWTFDKPGTFAFACLVPGHKEAGMVGQVAVQP